MKSFEHMISSYVMGYDWLNGMLYRDAYKSSDVSHAMTHLGVIEGM